MSADPNKIGLFARLPRQTVSGIRAIAVRRQEKVQDTVQKALDQYIAADRRR